MSKLRAIFGLFVLIAVFLGNNLRAQVNCVFNVTVTNTVTGAKISGAKVTLYKGGSVQQSATASSGGKATVKGPAKQNYKLTVTANGYVSKSIEMKFDNMLEEDLVGKDWKFPLDISLIEKHEDVDVSALESQSFAIGQFDAQSTDIAWDAKHIKKMQKLQDKIADEIEAKLQEEKANAAANEQKYNDLVTEGNKAVIAKDYENAIKKYQEAKSIKDNGTLDGKIADAQAKWDEQKKLDKQFDDLLAKGDSEMGKEDFDAAIGTYQQALNLKPDDSTAKTKLQEAKAAKEKKENEAAAEAQKKADFDNLMKEGNTLFEAQTYKDAKTKYESALALFPDDATAKQKLQATIDKIKELEDAEKAEQEKKANYDALIAEADNLYTSSNWKDAKAKYEEALELFDEAHPKNRIAECDKKIQEEADAEAAEKQKRADYDALIAEADGLFDSEKWEDAKSKYQAALKMFDEQHPKDKISAIDAKLKELEDAAAAEAEIEAKYKQLVEQADGLYDGKKWEDAKAKYEEALKLKENEQHPKDRISAIEEEIKAENEAAQQEEKFKNIVAEADKLYDAEDWANAKSKYNEALGIKSDDQHSKDRIEDIENTIKKLEEEEAEAAAQEAKFKEIIAEADDLFANQDWETARTKYQDALNLKSGDSHAEGRLEEIKKKIEEEANAEAEQKALDEEYAGLIKEADGLFDSESWEDAKSKYVEALEIKADESHPKDRISAIDKKLEELADAEAAEAKKEEDYKQLIADADGLYSDEKWNDAKAKYEQALELFDRPHPKDRIDAIQAKLDEIAAQDAEAAKIQEQYQALIDEANQLFDDEKWTDARAKYQEASIVKEDEQYPKDRMQEIDDKIKELADAEEAEKQKQIDYDNLIAEADAAYTKEDWETAKERYQKALDIFEKDHPKDRIAAIDEKLKEIEDAKGEEEKFNGLIAEADGLFDQESWEDAKAKYKEALAMKEDAHATQRIADIDQKLSEEAGKEQAKKEYEKYIKVADSKMDEGAYEEAKGIYERAKNFAEDGETYPDQQIKLADEKIAEQEARKAEFDSFISKADASFDSRNYDEAEGYYNNALEIIPDDAHAKSRIDQIAKIRKDLEEAQADENAKKEKKAAFDKLVKEGDDKMDAEEYGDGKVKYEEALAMFPDDAMVKQKLQVANSKLDEQNKQKRYDELIAKADKSFDEEKYKIAKADYEQAYALIPSGHAKDRIEEIDRLLSDASKEEQLLKEYAKIIKVADQTYKDGQLEVALDYFKRAKKYDPSQSYPDEMIGKIEAAIAKRDAEKGRYDEFIAEADKMFNRKKWDEAKSGYYKALGVFEEKYPRDQIALIDQRIQEEKDAEAAKLAEKNKKENFEKLKLEADNKFSAKDYDGALKTYQQAYDLIADDYVSGQITKLNTIIKDLTRKEEGSKMYDKIIETADEYFNSKTWPDARDLYLRASKLKPNDPYPNSQIAKIDAAIAAEKNAEKSERNKAEYDKLITKADNLFAQGEGKYKEARTVYQQAYDLVSMPHPKRRMDEIDQFFKDQSAKEAEEMYKKIVAQADSDYNAENWDDSKKYYQRALTMKPSDRYVIGKLQSINEILKANREPDYGERNDDIDEYSIDGMINDAQYKTYTDKVDSVYKAHADRVSIEDQYETESYEKRMNTHEKWDTYNDERLDNEKKYDDNRLANEKIAKQLELNDYAYENSLEGSNKSTREFNEDYADKKMTEKSANEIMLDKNRHRNEVVAEALNDDFNAWLANEEEIQENNTFTNQKYAKHNDVMRMEMEKAKDGNRRHNEDVAEILNDNRNAWEENESDIPKENMFTNEKYAKHHEDMKREMEEAKDGNRRHNEDVAEVLNDNFNSWLKNEEEIQTENTFNNEKYAKHNENMQVEMQKDRGKNQAYNHDIAEKLNDNHSSWEQNEQNIQKEKTFANEKYINSVDEAKSDMEQAKDGNRRHNEDVAEHLNDNRNAWEKNEAEIQEENMFANEKFAKDQAIKKLEMEEGKEDNRLANEKMADKLNEDMYADGDRKEQEQKARTEASADFFKDRLYADPSMYTIEYKNALATKYPEGVTTEKYARKDDDGKVFEITVRKVVVEKSWGNEYIMVANKYGRTYYKNGIAIPEFTYRDETAGSAAE